ncbi:MAG: hypothetical protein KDK34_04570 [Leptospiraceae bacterium]|nr:hypothetical protein [Leptospiraceae bacterium]
MGAERNRVIRLRIQTPEQFVYIGAIVMTQDLSKVQDFHAVAGDSLEIQNHTFEEPLKQFVSWKESLLFNERMDKMRTSDFERAMSRITINHDFLDRLRLLLQGKRIKQVTYDIKTELQVSLGIKDDECSIEMKTQTIEEANAGAEEIDTAEKAGTPEQDIPPTAAGDNDDRSDFAGLIPLCFVISPTRGKPLTKLEAGDEIVVRFEKPAEELSLNYIKSNGLMPEGSGVESLPTESSDTAADAPEQAADGETNPTAGSTDLHSIQTTARIKSIEPYGDRTLVYVVLPGDAPAYVLEEERTIMVKLPVSGTDEAETVATDTKQKTESDEDDSIGLPTDTRNIMMIAGLVVGLVVILIYLLL